MPVRSLAASQFGLTLVQTVGSGFHVGTTLKYIRGTLRESRGDIARPASGLLDDGDRLEGGEAEGRFDLDVGALAVAGGMRIGVLVRHLRRPVFGTGDGRMELPRQGRVGIAYDGASIGRAPWVLSMDADVNRTTTATGDRRVVAWGAERWLGAGRLGIRGGARFNTVGRQERTGTVGASVVVRPGLLVEAHGARGGAADDEGWGIGARVSF